LAHLGLLMLCAIAWAAFMNTMRIVVIGYCMVKMGIDLSTGWHHELVGLVLFGITLLLTASTDRFIGFLLHPIWSDPEQVGKKENSHLVRIWNRLFALGFPKPAPVVEFPQVAPKYVRDNRLTQLLIPVTMCFLVAGAFSGYCYAFHGGTGTVIPNQLVDQANRLGARSLPAQFAGWQQTEFQATRSENREVFGKHSRIWLYTKDDRTAVFSLDFMFNEEWHELCVCYESIGWERVDRSVVTPVEPPLVVAEFQKNETQFGVLQYSMMTDRGRAYDPPATQSFSSLVHRRLKKGTHRNVQIQLWATNSAKMTRQEIENLQELYVELRHQLAISMFAGVGE
jgi:hypothetical protein